MLEVVIPKETFEFFNEATGEFVYISDKDVKLQLQHSLVSLSKWEAKYKKPFLGKDDKTRDETLDYIKCMTITPKNVEDEIYKHIPSDIFSKITDYIHDTQTATWFREDKNRPKGRDTITAEIIYYWMISYNIPVDICQKWHLNRLLTLIKVFNEKNKKPRKTGKREAAANRQAILKARREQYGG